MRLFMIAMAVTACHSNETAPAPAAPVSAPTASASAAPAATECTAESTTATPIAMRPHSKEIFGQLDPKSPVTITARSKDGWLGFDPGVAQAANVGPFRLRWLDPTTVTSRGDCASVPEVWAPEPSTCFEMTMEDVVVREAPKATAKEVKTLHREEFAAIVERQKDWVKVDLSRGNTGDEAAGWIPVGAVNQNGQCAP
jgi:hypothetical protein